MEDLPENRDNAIAPWRRWAGNFYVQLAAAYAVVAFILSITFFVVRPSYAGDVWLLPLFAYWDPILSWWAVLAGVVAGAVFLLILHGARRGKPWVLGAGALLGIAGVNLAPGYDRALPFQWLNLFLNDARYIYQLPDMFSEYAGLTKVVFCKCRTRPGITYWLIGGLDRLFEGNIYVIAFFFVIAAALSVPVLYCGVRAVFNKGRAPWAVALFAVAPTLLIFGSEVDGFYCLVATSVLVLGIKAVTARKPWLWAIAAGVALAVALTTSFVQLVLIPVIALLVLAAALSGRGWGRPLACGLVIIATAVVALTAFQIATGYDHIKVFIRAYHMNQEFPAAGDNVFKFAARKLGLTPPEAPGPEHRSYLIYTVGNLYAMFLFMGVPTAVLYVRGLYRAVTKSDVRRSFYGITTIGFAVVFVAFNFSGLILGEVERIWLFLIPIFAITAGYELASSSRGARGVKLPALIIGLNVFQALIYNLLIYSKF